MDMEKEKVKRQNAKKPRNPRTRTEWQRAADWCEFLLAHQSAVFYGLVTGGPVVNVERCEEILEKAKAKGIVPAPDAIKRCAHAWQEEHRNGR